MLYVKPSVAGFLRKNLTAKVISMITIHVKSGSSVIMHHFTLSEVGLVSYKRTSWDFIQ